MNKRIMKKKSRFDWKNTTKRKLTAITAALKNVAAPDSVMVSVKADSLRSAKRFCRSVGIVINNDDALRAIADGAALNDVARDVFSRGRFLI